jgi:uncharacterized protein YjbI with pentapeptide repeats
MANPEHLELIEGGTKAIDAWRKRNPGATLDLSEADLGGADLTEVDLTGCDLHEAFLEGANLGGSNLTEADLNGANLNGATLTSATLKDANLSIADMKGADLGLASLQGAMITKVDLEDAKLRLANLQGANLSGSNLSNADLSSAILYEVDLSGAILAGANLKEADLRDTRMIHTDLNGADLGEADLCGCRLEQAYLDATDLNGARLGGSTLAKLDLSAVKNLETVVHFAPSTVGVDTLCLSRGKIPKAFLRGCGVPDELIAASVSLARAMGAVPFLSCFLSYTHQDQDFAQKLAAKLRGEHLRVWTAPDGKQGWKTPEQIHQAIRIFDKWLLAVSASNIRNDRVLAEIRRAAKAGEGSDRKLFLIGLEAPAAIAKWLKGEAAKDPALDPAYPVADFSEWNDSEAFDAAVADLVAELRGGAEEGEEGEE